MEEFESEVPCVPIADQPRLMELLPSHAPHEIEKLHQIASALERMGPCSKTRMKYVTKLSSGEVLWTSRKYYPDTSHGEAPARPIAAEVSLALNLLAEIFVKNYRPSAKIPRDSIALQCQSAFKFATILNEVFWVEMESARLNKPRGLRSVAYCLSEPLSEGVFLFERTAREIHESECPQTAPRTGSTQYEYSFRETDKAIFCWNLLAVKHMTTALDGTGPLRKRLNAIEGAIPKIHQGDRRFINSQFSALTKCLESQSHSSQESMQAAAHAILQDQANIRKLLSVFIPTPANRSRAMKNSGLTLLPDGQGSRASLIEEEKARLSQRTIDWGLEPD